MSIDFFHIRKQKTEIIEFGSLGGIRVSKLAYAVMRAPWKAGTLVITPSGPAVLIENYVLPSPGINIAVEMNALFEPCLWKEKSRLKALPS